MVAVAMLGSLTVLPAMLSKLGDRVDGARRPGRRASPEAARGRAARLGRGSSTACCAGPCCRAVLSAGLLVALAHPGVWDAHRDARD